MNEWKYEPKPLEEGDGEFIETKIGEDENSVVPPEPGAEVEDLVLKAVDEDGSIIGGCLLCVSDWKIAYLETLWVDEKYRRQGLGSALIRKAESVFREKGCEIVTLGTFDFQARPLYEKHGYTLCGTVENYPRGHENYSFMKRLDRTCGEYVPSNNAAAEKYEIVPGTEEDGEFIVQGLVAHNDSCAPKKREEVPLNKKLTDDEGKLIAGCVAGVDDWGVAGIRLWVDERWRGRGIGSRLLRETEREFRENGAYFVLISAIDWQAEFFKKYGYTVCTATEDYPKGHFCYRLRKDF